MSRPESMQGATEVMLKTEVEVGASGYSVTGGGSQGIFVKQVLKESSAAKLFSLREGDQLLSATIFFDDIKYEDALKILQYSEPYKVQFGIKRKLPDRENEEGALSDAQHGPKGLEKQDKEVADGCAEGPIKILEGGGDQDSLLPKAREGRGRRPQKERLSWPKFQAMRPKYGQGPRRSHSSSEAYERGAPDVSPTSTDTEAQLPGEEQELQGGQHTRKFLSLRFWMGSGRPGKGAQGGPVPGVLEEAEFLDTGVLLSTEPSGYGEGVPEEAAGPAARRRKKKTKEDTAQEEVAGQTGPRGGPASEQAWGEKGDAVRELEAGIAKLSLQDATVANGTQSSLPEIRVRIPHLQTPCFGVSKQKVLDAETAISEPQLGLQPGRLSGEVPGPRVEVEGEAESLGAGAPQEDLPEHGDQRRQRQTAGQAGAIVRAEEKDVEGIEGKLKMPKFKMPSFGWSPSKEPKTPGAKHPQEARGSQVIAGTARPQARASETETEPEHDEQQRKTSIKLPGGRADGVSLEGDVSLADKDVVTKDSKFKMPKFKMPSFGVSAPSKEEASSVDVSLPRVGVEASLPSLEGNIQAAEVKAQLPAKEVDMRGETISIKMTGEVSVGDTRVQEEEAGLKENMPKVQIPGTKMPKVDLKGIKVDVSLPDVEVSLPKVSVDSPAPRSSGKGVKVEGEVKLRDKDMKTKDSKFKMPSFKIPSFGASPASKAIEAPVDVPLPEAQVDVSLPSTEGEVKTGDLSIQLPSADVEEKGGEVGVKVPEGQLSKGELTGQAVGSDLKGHLPKFQMPSVTMTKVDFKAPQVDIKGPEVDTKAIKGEVATPDVDVSLPRMEVDNQVPGTKVEGDVTLGHKDSVVKDSKFKMPKFKMPSFGVSAPSKSIEASVDGSLQEAQVDVSLPSPKGEVKTGDLSIQLPSADVEAKVGEVGMKLPEGLLPEGQLPHGELAGQAVGDELKGHLPKFQIPSVKMPKVDFKAPQVDTKGPKVDLKGPKLDMKGFKGEVDNTDLEVALPSVEVDIQALGAKLEGDVSLGDKDLATKDSRFKMPKFKMPSFGVSAPRKDLGSSVDLPGPKEGMESSLPSLGVEITPAEGSIPVPRADITQPGAELDLSVPEVEVTVGELKDKTEGARIKEQLPKVQMPDIKMPKVDLKGPKVDISFPEVDVSLPKVEVSAPAPRISMEGVKVDGDVKMEDKNIKTKEGKFKMPSFQMPSFGVSVPSKSTEASVDVSLPEAQVDVSLPSPKEEVKTGDLSIQLPSADMEVKGGEVSIKVPEGQLSKGELTGQAVGSGLKGHLPKFQMPSVTVPKVDFRAPQVDIKGPKVDLKGPKEDLKALKREVATPDVDVSLPSVEVDIQAPDTKVESDMSLGHKDSVVKDSKFKMPKFKMPSFGVSAPSKSIKASVDVSLQEAQVDVALPSPKGEVKTGDLSIQLPSADVEVKGGEVGVKLPEGQLPEGQLPQGELAGQAIGDELKGHLPKFQIPSIKVPKVDFKAPQVHIKGPKVDLKGPKLDMKGFKGEVDNTNVQVALPTVEVDIQAPGAKVEGDVSLGDKDLATKDSKFKMPKFKMPSFGVSAPRTDLGIPLDLSVPKVGAESSLPSLGVEIAPTEGSIPMPSADITLTGTELDVSLPLVEVAAGEIKDKTEGARIKGQLPKVQTPDIKMPKVDLKGPKVDISLPEVDVSLPKVDMDAPVPGISMEGVKVEGDVKMEDKDIKTKEGKFKMPSFKMPSFGVSVPSKSMEASVDVSLPETKVVVSLPSTEAEVKTSDLSIHLTSADKEGKSGEVGVKLPKRQLPEGDLAGQAVGARLKGDQPKFQTPDIKLPKVDFKAPHVDIEGPKMDLKASKVDISLPKVDLSLPKVEVDAPAPGISMEGVKMEDVKMEYVKTKDSKFKMPSFKMPSFGVSVPSKSTEASMDVSLPETQVDVSLPSIEGEVKIDDLSIQLPSANVEVKGGEVGIKFPEGQPSKGELMGQADGSGLKGHLPKFQMPSVKAPQVDIKGPKVDLKGPKEDLKALKGEVATPDVDMSLPSVEVDIQGPDSKVEGDMSLGDKDLAAKDSKFKMPKFKMPSFGVSAPRKNLGTSVDLPGPKSGAESSLHSLGVEIAPAEGSIPVLSADIALPGMELDVSHPEVELAAGELKGKTEGAKIKGHLTKVQMLDIKRPKVELKDPKVDISLPEENVLLPKVDVDAPSPGISMKGVKVEDVRMEDKDIKAKESKFKMPSIKMTSFGMSAPSKSMEASVDMSLPEAKAEVSLPSIERKVKTCDLSVQLPSADKEGKGGEEGVKLLVGQLPEGDLAGQAVGAGLKGHQPKLQMPDIKMPKVDFKAPDVDIEDPKVDQKCPKKDVKGPKGEVTTTVVQVSMPSVEMDIQAPEKNVVLGDKDLATKTSKFKMPKFKVPSFGVSTPSKSIEASMDVSLPEAQVDMSLPSIEGEVKTSDVSIQLPSADMEVKDGKVGVKDPDGLLSKEELTGQAIGSGFKGHLSKFQMPSVTVPKVDFKASQVDVKGPKVDLKGPKEDLKALKGEVASPDVHMSLPSIEVDIQAPDAKVEGDVSLEDKDLVIKDSKFKMPKFKMPSFGLSAPSKSIEASVDVPLQEVQVDVSLPSPRGEVKTGDLSIQLPSADVEVKDGEVGMNLPEGQLPEGQLPQGELTGQAMVEEFKGHLPKFQITSIKMPKVDFKAPQVDTKGPKMDLKGPKLDMKGFKGEVDNTDMEVALPSVEVDIQAPDAKVEGRVSLRDKDSATKDSRFKMPKFRIPSFGVSAPGKDLGTSVDLPGPKVGVESSLPSFGVQIAPAEGSIPVPSADIIPLGAELDVSLPEVEVAAGKLKGKTEMARIKGDLSKVQMPDIKMPTVDLKGPKVDISLPEVDMSLPKVEVDALAHGISMEGGKVEGDVKMEDKTTKAKEGKFKLPSIKMPSFGVSAPSKSTEASVDVSLPEAAVDVSLPSIEGEVKTSDFSIQPPSADVEVQGGEVGAKVPEGQLSKGELMGQADGSGLKGHLPKFQMPSVTVPKVDFKAPQVDIKGPKVDLKGPKEDLKALKGEVATPDVDMSLPSVEVDIRVPGTKVEGDVSLGDKDLVIKDSKFKMPKFKIPSFGVSVPSKSIEASVDTSLQEAQVDVSLPSPKGEVKTGDLSIQLPSADVEVKGGEVDMKLREGPLPEGQLPQGELAGQASGEELKGHLPKFQIPSIRMPKVDFKAPQVDTKGPKMDLKGPKLDMKGFKGEVDNTDMEVALPSVKVDIQATGAKVEGDVCLGDKDLATKDSKFKMPKLKMPSFRVSAPSKDLGSSVDLPGPKTGAESFPHSVGVEITAAEGSIPVPCADIALSGAELDLSFPDVEVAAGELKGKTEGARIKGQLPKVQMPDIKMPMVDLKGPKVDISLPEVDVSLPKVEVDAPAPSISMKGVKMDGDVMMEDKDIKAKESKFKMPSIKMPSFGVSAPSKSMEASVDASLSEAKVDVSFPSIKGDVKTSDLSIQLSSANKEGKGGEVDVKLPEGQLPEGDLVGQAVGARLKGHLPKFQMPDIKMPKVDFEAPHVDIKDPKVDLKGPKVDIGLPEVDMPLSKVEADALAPRISMEGMKVEGDVKMEDKDVKTKYGKFKVPSFKMPSFGVSRPSKSTEASLDVSLPEAQVDVSFPSTEGVVKTGDLSIQLPSANVEVKGGEVGVKFSEGQLSKGELTGQADGSGLEGHLPKFQMPSVTVPKVDIKGPKVDLKGPKEDLKALKGEVATTDVDVSLPSVEVNIQAPSTKVEGDVSLGHKDLVIKDSKFKMPKFKMPSFGVSAPSKSIEASVDGSLQEAQVDVALPSPKGEVKTGDLSLQLPSADVEVKGGEVGIKLPEGQFPERDELKGHLPKFQEPSIKMPKVDFKAPQVDIKGPKMDLKGPKLDMKGFKGEGDNTDVEVALPSVEVDIQAPGAKVEGDASLGDKDLATKDSKFKMPKFKMPSFGVSAPRKDLGTSVDLSGPKVSAESSLPSLGVAIAPAEGSIPVPCADITLPGAKLDLPLPEVEVATGELKGKTEGARIKGHLPKVQVPDIKLPKVDLKGPKVDVSLCEVDVSLPSVEVGAPAPGISMEGVKVEGDVKMEDKDVKTKDGKFKMPSFKMPSFGVSTPSKSLQASVDMSLPEAQVDASLPFTEGEVKTSDLSIQLPSADVEVKGGKVGIKVPESQLSKEEPTGQAVGSGLKGHLPKFQMPSVTVPKVDFKAPQVDIKGPKVDLKGPQVDLKALKGEVAIPDMDSSLPSVEKDIQVVGIEVEDDVSLRDKVVKDSKFKLPKFKMPSFGVSARSKDLGTSVDLPAPKVDANMSLPSLEVESSPAKGSIPVPSADITLSAAELDMSLPEVEVAAGELKGKSKGATIKGHLPEVQIPDIKMPEVDLKGTKVDISLSDVEVPLPKVLLDAPAPKLSLEGTKVEGDVKLGDKDVKTKDSKFKMPSFKMPSFGASVPSKSIKAPGDVSLPEAQVDVSLPSSEGEVKTSDLRIQLPSADMEVKGGEVGVKLPEGQLPERELKVQALGDEFKGHLPKFQMPKVDFKAPQEVLKDPKVDLKVLKGDKATEDTEVSLPSVELDIQAQGTKVEGDASLGDKDVVVKDSRFRMPRRLSMPSFGKSSSRVATGSSQVAGSVKCPELTVSTATTEPGLSASGPDVPDSSVGVTTALPVGNDGEKSKAKKPHFKMPKGFFPPLKSSKDQVTPHQDSGVPPPQHVSAALPDIPAGLSQEEVSASGTQSPPVPKVGLAGLPSAKLDLRVPREESVLPSSHGVTLTKYQVMLAMATVHAELPPDTIPVPNTDAPLPSHEGSAELQPHDKAPASTETLPSPGGPLAPATYGGVTFPKFHKPKFGFSVLTAADAEGGGSAAEKIEASPPPCTALPSADAPVCTGLEGHSGPDITAAVALGEAPSHDTECEAKGSPFKRPRLKLPSLSWSPKEAGPQRDPEGSSADTELSLGLDPDQPGAQTGIHASQVEADADLPPEKDGSKGRMRKSGFTMPKLPFSKVKGGPGLPPGEVQPCLSGPKAAAERTSSDKDVAGGAPDGEDQDPTLGLTKPVHRPSEAEVEVSWPEATTRLPEHDPSLQESSVGLGLKDSPAHPPHREGTAPPMEQALQPASALLGADTHTVESLDGDAQATGAPAGSKEGWFRVPKFHLPGFWRASTKEKSKAAVAEAQGPGPGGGDAAAGVQTQGANVQGSTEETAVSLQPTDAKADGTASETDSYADVLKRDVHGTGLNMSLATARAAAADLSAPEAGVGPGEGSLPLWMPLGRLSEGQFPPGQTDETAPPGPEGGPTSVEEGAERQLAPTEGPLKLKTSQTEMPAQVSVIQVDRLWEDSVVTVTFPKLKSPRFAFHASSTDADVFVPSVREVPCLGTGTEGDLQGESPGVWGATILKAGSGVPAEQPGDAADSSEASPRSRVRVHIQGARVESQAVTAGSGVTPVSTESSGPEAFPTQIVRESEVPASEIQMPSYGFSLLKVKIPEPPQQARVHVAIHGSQAGEASEEAPQKAAPEVDPISADLQPDTGEPFEIISASVSVPRLHACPSEVPAGRQGADSCSDEEPAEILEFPSEDSREVATLPADEDVGQKEKLASKKPSGLFRFWLPNIGFSSSVDETCSDPRDDVQISAPIETQPEAGPETELPKKQEKAGWFRFPRLGFSSSPTRKSKSTKDEAKLAEQTVQEEGVTFFDTHESFSPEDKEEGELAEAGPACGMETSTARTEQSLLEQEEHASGESAPRPTTK
ncbi:protein AHNAK2 [Trichechus manatus latirostris]|uniref:Protein AHNAK2 n=1 Tax=Trichechus manatus latirostris TaxID=127582 RepID=A0A2Y9QVS2_TRIMA|nr:protein AHNAK2 [Trichechus manatus latirostris]